MHLDDPNSFASAPSTPVSKKRKRDLGGGGGTTWNNENLTMGEHTGFMDASPFQLNCHDIDVDVDVDDHDMNLNPVPMPCFLPSSTPIDLDSRPRLQPTLSKRRRILQQSQQQQQQQQQQQWPNPSFSFSRSPPSSHGQQSRKPQPPSLLIPPSSSLDGKISPEVSPRTVEPLPPPLLRPCHICHRRPTTRVMLDAYADCELCGERACYICLRECNAVGCGTTAAAALSGVTSTSLTPTTPEGVGGGGEGGGGGITIKDGYLYGQQQQLLQYTTPGDGERRQRQRKICSCCAVEGLTETGDEIVWCLDCVRGRHPSWK
ncbi:hypothetical protein VTN77DRAFT_5903 [Rasamsonia byssochlamydoides]|uniref:uncharacterized protein n=1 Tax=Rasamsonia byssochlamydoides TaxID=89139 RepID=UPI0037443D8E